MGILAEFNPDLALRAHAEYLAGRRLAEECVPETLRPGDEHPFLKSGQRVYWLSDDPRHGAGQVPLRVTAGNQELSRPVASVKILEVTHFLRDGQPWTRGRYRVVAAFSGDAVEFECCERISR